MSSSPVTSTPQIKRALRGRRVVLVDIENVAGGAILSPDMAEWAHGVIDRTLGGLESDQIIIGTCHLGLVEVKRPWPRARAVVRSGQDGADLALLDVLRTERLAERFDEVVLVSGDGIFAKPVAELEEAGVAVTVSAWSFGLSTRLRLAAGRVVSLDGWHEHHAGQVA